MVDPSNNCRQKLIPASPIGAQLRIIASNISGFTWPSIDAVRVAIYLSCTGVKSGNPISRRASSGVHSTSTLIFIDLFNSRLVNRLSKHALLCIAIAMYARDQAIIATPIGSIRLEAREGLLMSLTIEASQAILPPTSPVLVAAEAQLLDWFRGERRFFDLPLAPLPSQRGNVLRQGMIDIGYGDIISYGALARLLGSSPRAIGQACARNPLPIIVPCHRVLPSGGALGAYSGGEGPVTKALLLAHEAQHRQTPFGQLGYATA